MENNNRNSTGGNNKDLNRILEEAASKASNSSSADPTIEKARSEITSQADIMLREIEERRARRAERLREMEQQIIAEEEAKARRMARAKANEASSAERQSPAKPVPAVSSSDSVFSNQPRPSARSTARAPQMRRPEQQTSRPRQQSSDSRKAQETPSRRQAVKPGETQVMPKITEAVPQRPSGKTAQSSARSKEQQKPRAPRPASAPNAKRSANKAKPKKNGEINMMKEIRDWVVAIAIAVVLALLIRNFVFTLVKVQGASMQPTLHESDRLYVNRFFYTPEKGDVIIFEPASDPDRPYVKRVIATEGDTVYIDFETGDVYVNDEIIDEPYINDRTARTGSYIMELIANGQYSKDNPIVVEKDKVFVMGDNRNNSKDSREIGQVPKKEIIGGAVFRFWPVSGFGSVAYPIETSYLIEDENHDFKFIS